MHTMSFYREPVRVRRRLDCGLNSVDVEQHTAYYVRRNYRTLRRAGASIYQARTALYDMLFYAGMFTPGFTVGAERNPMAVTA